MVLRVSRANSIPRILLTGIYHQLKRQLSPQKKIAMIQIWRVHLLSVPNIWRNPMTSLLPAWRIKLVHQLHQRQLRQRQLHQRQLRQRQYLHALQKMDHVPTSMLLAAEIKLASQIQILILEASYVKHLSLPPPLTLPPPLLLPPPLQPLKHVLQKMDLVPTSMLFAAEIKLASQIQILILEASYVKHRLTDNKCLYHFSINYYLLKF